MSSLLRDPKTLIYQKSLRLTKAKRPHAPARGAVYDSLRSQVGTTMSPVVLVGAQAGRP